MSQPGPGDQYQRLTPPREVTASFWMWIAGSAFSVLSVILLLTQLGAIEDDARRVYLQAPASAFPVDQAVQLTMVFTYIAAGLTVLVAALFAFFAFKVKDGRNWARTTLTVLVVLYVLLTLFGVAAGGSLGAGGVIGYLIPVLGVVATVLLYLPASNVYFASVKRQGA